MHCVPASRGALLIVHGGAEPREIEIMPDPDYEAAMWERINAFEICVRLLTPPSPIARVVPPDQWRTVNLDALPSGEWPNWARAIADDLKKWSVARPMALEFEDITARIKSALPDDVGRYDYDGYTVRRNRRGAIAITDDNHE
jgi:hypothetical protein